MDRVAAYVRVSTEKQMEQDSHERQKETVKEWCKDNLSGDYQIEWYEDIAESGQDLSRDKYKELMDNVGDYDKLVVRELSRFGRDMQKLLNDIEKLEDADCDFISVKDDEIDTSSAQGKLFFHIIAAFNQFWADIARERTEEMIQRRREEGKPIGRPKKLSDEQIKELQRLRENEDYSYATLAAIAEQKWDVELHRQTVSRYMEETDL